MSPPSGIFGRRTRATDRSATMSQRSFARVPSVTIPRSVFNRSHTHTTAFNSGFLVPFFVDEALPGDTMSMRTRAFVRMATPIYPVMDNLWMDCFFFFVPNRLLWTNWERFMGEQDNPGDSTDFVVPQMTQTPVVESLSDYFGIPIGNALTFNSLHHRAYNLIWNDWFRDENLQDSVTVDVGDGPDDPADYVLLRRGKRHDYFSSCLPFTQKGDAVELPLGTTAPVTISGAGDPTFDVGGTVGNTLGGAAAGPPQRADWATVFSAADASATWNDPALSAVADLSAATAATINQIREAFQIQRLLERDARGGSRYTEIVRSHFGVVSPDARLQRPEFLGGGSARINTHPVAATTDLGTTTIGDIRGFVTGFTDELSFFKSFTEHGVIIGLCSVRADIRYQQGLHRMWSRQSRFDFYWPSLAHLGEQAVLSKEIFADGSPADNDVFGYQERYGEYRYYPSRISGVMRSTAAAPLDPWHLALDFATRPLLNDTFIQDQPPVQRVIAIPATLGVEFLADFDFQYRCARPMPTFGVPGFVDHF